jgi:hypothetical protein
MNSPVFVLHPFSHPVSIAISFSVSNKEIKKGTVVSLISSLPFPAFCCDFDPKSEEEDENEEDHTTTLQQVIPKPLALPPPPS